jgi:hypothetical protein
MLNAAKAKRKPVYEQWYGHCCQHDKNEKYGGRVTVQSLTAPGESHECAPTVCDGTPA